MNSLAVDLKSGQSSSDGHFPCMVEELYCNCIDSFMSYVPVEGRSCELDSHPAFYIPKSKVVPERWAGEDLGSFKRVFGFYIGREGEEFLGHGKHGLNFLVSDPMIGQSKEPVAFRNREQLGDEFLLSNFVIFERDSYNLSVYNGHIAPGKVVVKVGRVDGEGVLRKSRRSDKR